MSNTPINTLIVAPAWVGDMLMSQPLYALLQQQDQVLDVLAPVSTSPLATRMSEIRHTIAAPFKHSKLQLGQRRSLAKTLRQRQYQHAIVLPNTLKSALIPWLARIPKRTGWLGEQRFLLLNDYRKLDAAQYPSLVARYAALALPEHAPLPTLIKPHLNVDEMNQQHCLTKLKLQLKRPIIALCPGAEYGPAKRWPAEYFAEVAQHFLKLDWQVWLFGTARETNDTKIIQELTQHGCVDLTGKTSLLDAIDLLATCQLAVSNDSGLMHIAAAVGVPLVAVYGSTSPTYTPPATDKATILQLDYPCIPCFKRECPLQAEEHLRCLKHLRPQQVLTALQSWLP